MTTLVLILLQLALASIPVLFLIHNIRTGYTQAGLGGNAHRDKEPLRFWMNALAPLLVTLGFLASAAYVFYVSVLPHLHHSS